MYKVVKGDIIEGRIVDLASGGEGVLKLDGYAIFVPFSLPGELVRARIDFARRDCAFATLVEVKEKSEDRVKPICPYFGKCGGCDLQHMSERMQIAFKTNAVKLALKKFASLTPDVPDAIRLNSYGYRNKISLPFAFNAHSGRVSLGFYEKRSHKVVPIKFCPLHGEWAADIIRIVCEWANENRLSVYDETTGKGLLRHIVARMMDSLSLTVVVNDKRLEAAEDLTARLQTSFDDFVLYVSPNLYRTNVIMGDSVIKLYGEEKFQKLGKFSAVVSPMTFLQVNAEVRDVIYDDVASLLSDFDGDITELYSGAGVLTAELASRLPKGRITSVEIVLEAVEDAKKLFKSLNLDNITAVCADAPEYMRDVVEKGGALILDPPRRGCDAKVIQGAIEQGYDKIVYISCDPLTLARDIALLKTNYTLKFVKVYDMFPQTANCETLVCLEKNAPQ